MKTPLSSILLVVLSSFIGSFGAVLLKAGSGKLTDLRSLILNWRLGLGIAFFLVSSYFFVLGVRNGQLTILYPMASLGYIWTMIWGRMFFKEPFTPNKFLGLGLILLGLVFLGLGNR